ncbi:MAG: carboxylating nicotinate-nucleotide diphosphorylase [Rhodothermales bacterium]|nr:carboxylating nicotinate-nucleotide diphosphorylase [Rhodothermales bacterium]MBO6779155.1 carboxylating nicotinate-nucleotide diphosphorylase [Rhodothermales bacterium]
MTSAVTTLPPYLTVQDIDAVVRRGLLEDVGAGDVTTLATIDPERRAEAVVIAKDHGVVAGLLVAERVFAALPGPVSLAWEVEDGQRVAPGQLIGRLTGNARSILEGERLALNLMQRLGGIATATARMVEAAGGRARILDTRKTAPGLRTLDKWAVLLGGGTNHRVGLHDMILIKDNHIAACGGVRQAVEAANRFRVQEGRDELEIELEVRTDLELAELLEVGGVERVLLDNMVSVDEDGTVHTSRLQAAVERVGGTFLTEASGNVTLATVPAIAATGVDFISSGALTHSVRALDISLKVTLSA